MKTLVVVAAVAVSVAFVFARTQCEPNILAQAQDCTNYRLTTSLIYGGAIGLIAGFIGVALMSRVSK